MEEPKFQNIYLEQKELAKPPKSTNVSKETTLNFEKSFQKYSP